MAGSGPPEHALENITNGRNAAYSRPPSRQGSAGPHGRAMT